MKALWVAVCLWASSSLEIHAFTLISNAGKIAYWNSGNVNYYFHSSVDSGIRSYFRDAFDVWANVAGVSLSTTDQGTQASSASSSDGKNTIVWVTSGWRNLSFRPPSNALAVTLLSFDDNTGRIVDADIYFNSQDFDWGDVQATSDYSLMDIQNIATHEIGHLLGADHSSEAYFEDDALLGDATMYYASGAGETMRRDLNGDDQGAVQALYGSGESVPTVASAEVLDITPDGTVYDVTGTNFGEHTSFILTRFTDAVSDRVSRYKTVTSSTRAQVTIDVEDFGNGQAQLLAFNHPSDYGALSFEVTDAGYNATAGGGGGCSLSAASGSQPDGGEFSWVTFYFVSFSLLSLLAARRRFQTSPRRIEEEEEY